MSSIKMYEWSVLFDTENTTTTTSKSYGIGRYLHDTLPQYTKRVMFLLCSLFLWLLNTRLSESSLCKYIHSSHLLKEHFVIEGQNLFKDTVFLIKINYCSCPWNEKTRWQFYLWIKLCKEILFRSITRQSKVFLRKFLRIVSLSYVQSVSFVFMSDSFVLFFVCICYRIWNVFKKVD